ncbi:hypothetical protein Tco_0274073, partial [Tanacetum coccineum]
MHICSTDAWDELKILAFPQDDLSRSTPPSEHPSRPASRTAFEINDETLGPNDAELVQPQHGAKGPPTSYSYAAALGASLSRSTTTLNTLLGPQALFRPLSEVDGPMLQKEEI